MFILFVAARREYKRQYQHRPEKYHNTFDYLAPENSTEMLALNIYNTFYGRVGWQGVGQAKAVVFFIIVAVIAFVQLRLTGQKEVEQ